ncbi:MAG TPA: hypothetical protein VGG06_07730 [Thermoanaerobaculia bacterium]|jgi:ABC-type spermidine/putrescine transport system permease subunit II
MSGFWLDAAVNSALIVAGVSALSLAIAVPAAWLIARTDLPGAAFLHRVFTLSYALPSYLLAIAWEILANPTRSSSGSPCRCSRATWRRGSSPWAWRRSPASECRQSSARRPAGTC